MPTPDTIIVYSGQSIRDAAKKVPDGGFVVVAPGTYRGFVLQAGDLQGSVTLFADVTGEFSNSAAAAVTIQAGSGDRAAIEAVGQTALGIDGFTLQGGTKAGFLCNNCSGTTVQDCTVTNSAGDAVRLESSDAMLVFNNLLVGNKGAGVRALGTTNLEVINNTIYQNKANGIVLSFDFNQSASTGAFVVNNILAKNSPSGIVVDSGPPSSLDGYDGNFNLNTNGYSGTSPGESDSVADPLFIFPAGGDFRLATGSQAIDSGTDDIDTDLVDELEQLTTRGDGSLDTPPLDLGYHYIAPIPTPTRVPKPTKTPIPSPTRVPATATPRP